MTTWEGQRYGASKSEAGAALVDLSMLTLQAKQERVEILSYQAAIAILGDKPDLASMFIAERDKIAV